MCRCTRGCGKVWRSSGGVWKFHQLLNSSNEARLLLFVVLYNALVEVLLQAQYAWSHLVKTYTGNRRWISRRSLLRRAFLHSGFHNKRSDERFPLPFPLHVLVHGLLPLLAIAGGALSLGHLGLELHVGLFGFTCLFLTAAFSDIRRSSSTYAGLLKS